MRRSAGGRRMTEKNGATGGTPPDPAAPATAADIAALQQQIDAAANGLKLYRSEENVIEHIRKRFANTAVIAAAVGFIGIQVVAYAVINLTWGPEIRETVTDGVKAIAKLEAVVAQATKAATKANDAAVAASKKAEAATGRFDKIDERITKAIAKVDSDIAGASGSARAAADKAVAVIQKQLANFQEQINTVSRKAKVDVKILREKQDKLRTDAEKEREKFAENGRFFVRVRPVGTEFIDDAKKLSRDLTRKGGFKGSVSDFFAEKDVANTTPPSGVKRSADKIVTIIAHPDNTDTTGKIPEIEEILRETLSGFEVRRDFAGNVKPILNRSTRISLSTPSIYVYLSNWPMYIKKTESRSSRP